MTRLINNIGAMKENNITIHDRTVNNARFSFTNELHSHRHRLSEREFLSMLE